MYGGVFPKNIDCKWSSLVAIVIHLLSAILGVKKHFDLVQINKQLLETIYLDRHFSSFRHGWLFFFYAAMVDYSYFEFPRA